jgi:putative DNA methylase
VAVLINKALIEIPPKFANCMPVHPEVNQALLQREWRGAQGLAEDLRYYGRWMREEAWKRIGHLYPKVTLPKEYGGGEATVIAWLWTRTITCPNPACGAEMPLISSFWLSTKEGRKTWVEPIVDQAAKGVRFEVRRGTPSAEQTQIIKSGTKTGRGASFNCIVCGQAAGEENIKAEFQAKHNGEKLLAIVAEGKNGRIYLPPIAEHEIISRKETPDWQPSIELSDNPRHMTPPSYGMKTFTELFTIRQLVAVTTFSDLVSKAREKVLLDVHQASLGEEDQPLSQNDTNAQEYADAIVLYLGLNVSKLANRSSTICFWDTGGEKVQQVFARQALSITWDFTEGNPFSDSSGNFMGQLSYVTDVLESLPCKLQGRVQQLDATVEINGSSLALISTDPPYYDNVPYADLSDFFYVWLRHSLSAVYPDLFSTLLVPKKAELVADPHRHGSKENARHFFEEGLSKAFTHMLEVQHPYYPLTIYYAFKQADSDKNDSKLPSSSRINASTGWETMLEGLLKAGFIITGTWPVRTEGGGLREVGRNALASSIVLVCRPLPVGASKISRGEFLRALKRELPAALKDLQRGNIAPVDLAQAAIGPGMAIFSRYSKVLEPDGSPMRVRTALQLINQTLDEVLAEQEGEYDGETRWAVAWFEQYGMDEGPYGVAETLSKAKNAAVERLAEAGILVARGGKVRLLRREEMSQEWNPARQQRLTVWEVTQRLIHALKEQGEQGAAAILDHTGNTGEIARDLAYRLYTTCERKGWAQEALDYNTLVVEWRDIAGQAEHLPVATQAELFD